ncbi:MAG TPA: tripartite tricarboxylate transporter substrate binding protein [Burkholderiaceae bacterium]|nr:tripartite tricarboxylate transporter substrate binding protein [Burkholderiaceae bacterium]
MTRPTAPRRRIVGALLSLAALGAASPAAAQPAAWPSKPIRMVIPFPAGGATDVLGRVVAQRLSTALGQQVIVENRPGAGGSIGADTVAKAPPDGHVILMSTSSTHSIGPALNPKMPYDAQKDFVPVAHVATAPNVLVVGSNFPASDARQMVALLKSNPGRYNFGSSGIGTIPHLSAELFKWQGGNLFAVHIPYRGTGLVIPDLIAGQIAFLMDSVVTAAPHVRDGKLKALAVTGTRRSGAMPEVATFAEQGVPGMDAATWFGLFVPAGTPAAIVQRLNEESNAMLRSPDVVDRLAKLGADPAGGSPEAFARVVRGDYEKWAAVIRRAGIKPE